MAEVLSTHSTSNAEESKEEDIVTFSPNDPENPRNWSRWKKYSIIGPLLLVDLTVSFGASGFSPASTKFTKDFGASSEVGTLGLSVYVGGLALGPMLLAPLSEYFGRTPLYIFPYALYLCFLVGTATVPNLGGFLPLRFLSGFFSSVTIANIGGTISDLYDYHHTGYAMSLYLWAATCGSPLGYFLFSFVAQYRSWRDVIWAILGVSGGAWLIMLIALLTCGETSHAIILLRRAKRLRKEGHNTNVPERMRQRGIRQLFKIALSRPFRFLFTEPVVIFASLYNGYLYGLSFLFNDAFSVIFGPGEGGKGYNSLQVGLAFLGIVVGISLGPITNVWQEKHYRKRTAQCYGENIPESRVQLSQLAAVALPVSLFIFAFTSYRYLTWIGPVIASGLWGWSFFTLILMTYLYAEDCYGMFSASALAGIGLVRNAAGAGFPLFARQLFVNEGFQYAGLILACLALVLIPIPFVLAKKGAWLRKRSQWAREIMRQDKEGLR